MKPALVSACILVLMSSVTAQTEPPVVYVAGDGSGDFNCDGSDDQVEINQALDFVAQAPEYSTVHLRGPATFRISSSIYISANTVLEGDSSAVVKLVDEAGWGRFQPLIGQTGTVFAPELNNPELTTYNITIRGFEIDGNKDNQTDIPDGDSFYTIIQLQNCYQVTISDLYLHDNNNDAIRFVHDLPESEVNSEFGNLRIHDHGHSGIYLINADYFQVHDNIITGNRTDAGIRPQYCNHFAIRNNIIANDPDRPFSGGAAIEIQADAETAVDDVEICGNYLYGNQYWHGIWLNQQSGGGTLNTHRDVHIHHNIISWYLQAGIGIYGFHHTLIENNIIERSEADGGIVFFAGDPENSISGFQTIVRNNIIFNNSTYGIDNQQPSIHSFDTEYNCIFGNGAGHYHNASSATDLYVDPTFAAGFESVYNILSQSWQEAASSGNWRGDLGARQTWLLYHLKSESGRWDGSQWVDDTVTSLCIDAGDPAAVHGEEPAPNGARINVGAFGNTPLASKSINMVVLSIALTGGMVQLSWTAIPEGFGSPVTYSVHRSLTPYFECTPENLLAETSETSYQISPGGDPGNRFYRVVAKTVTGNGN